MVGGVHRNSIIALRRSAAGRVEPGNRQCVQLTNEYCTIQYYTIESMRSVQIHSRNKEGMQKDIIDCERLNDIT